ncbi:unnamed protein product [Prorocentrum cordatum]|uniref:Uncharacterized protein n=1 Tax=Prorocentrum cordatum TaxID=2364126 RepID=A0ABN9PTR1_9DINO|nr:unnamed protein product [Polarella glacialis]
MHTELSLGCEACSIGPPARAESCEVIDPDLPGTGDAAGRAVGPAAASAGAGRAPAAPAAATRDAPGRRDSKDGLQQAPPTAGTAQAGAARPLPGLVLDSGRDASGDAGAGLAPSAAEEGEHGPLPGAPGVPACAGSALPGCGLVFVRRRPEEFSKPTGARSSLTAELRRLDRRTGCAAGDSVSPPGGHRWGLDAVRTLELRVHLAPYGGEAITVEVPACMCVAALSGEVMRQSRRRRRIQTSASCEVRVYDESQRQPDYSYPPFDPDLRLGSLGVRDVAMCPLTCPPGTPPSPPLAAPSEGCELSVAAVTPLADFCALARRMPCAAGASKTAPSIQGVHRPARGQRGSRAAAPGRGPTAPQRGSKGQESGRGGGDTHAGTGEIFMTITGDGEADGASWTEDEATVRRARQHSDTHLQLGGPPAPPLSQPRSRSMSMPSLEPLVTSGGFEAVPATSRAADRVPSPSAGARTLWLLLSEGAREAAPPLGPCGGAGCTGAPEAVALSAPGGVTLHEVLERLSRERGRRYDPVSFAIERLTGGATQRLDLNMQVKHLQPGAATLRVVQKYTPTASPSTPPPPLQSARAPEAEAGGAEHGPSLCSHPAFLLSEHAAAIATEYLVTVAVQGSRARPVECLLVVDRDLLRHRPPRRGVQGPEQRKGLFIGALLRKLGSLERGDPDIFSERNVRDITDIFPHGGTQSAFSVVYNCLSLGIGSDDSIELVYEAQTPTERADIFARLRFLQMVFK